MVAVVTGSTGLVGSVLIKKLLGDSKFSKVISVSRETLNITDPKLQEVLIRDLAELPTLHKQLKADIYFSCLGTTIKTAGSKSNFRKVDYDAVFNLGKIAKAHEARNFILVSATGSNSKSRFFYNQVKGEIEAALQSLNLLSLTIYRPSLLVGERKDFRFAEKLATQILKPLSAALRSSKKPRLIQASRNIVTDVDVLADHMIDQAKSVTSGTQIVKASAIA